MLGDYRAKRLGGFSVGIPQLDVDDCRNLTVLGWTSCGLCFFSFLLVSFSVLLLSELSSPPSLFYFIETLSSLLCIQFFVVLFIVCFLLFVFFPPLLWVVKNNRKIIMEIGS